jgi:alpha-glucosidase
MEEVAIEKKKPLTRFGEIELLAPHPQVLAYVRSLGPVRILCAFNLDERPAQFALRDADAIERVLDESGARGAVVDGPTLHFEPYGALFARLA